MAPSLPYGVELPFVQHLGIILQRFDNGHSELHYTPRPEHLNNLGVTHGGASLTLMDVAMGTAARSAEAGSAVVTVELKCSFMRPAHGAVVARGQLLYRSRGMAFMEAKIYDAQEQLCAHATGTFKYVQQPKADVAAGNTP